MAKSIICVTGVSKSKSKPSTLEVPKGRSAFEDLFSGPKVAQSLVALSMAAEDEGKPPSVYVAPPSERRTVLPLDWQALMSSLGIVRVA